jgi:anti-sigma-K factor RskA
LKHENVTEEIQETASLYALGALSQHEARAFEFHMDEGCEVCARELVRFERVLAGLGMGVPPIEPPASIRDRLAARLEQERPISSPPLRVHADQKGVSPPARPYLPWLIAASVALIALVSVIEHRRYQEVDRQQQMIAATRSEAAQLKAQLDQQKGKLQELEQIRDALSAPESRVIFLSGQEPTPPTSATIVWDTKANQWLVTANLPQPPAGKIYQLWFVTASAKVSAGLIQPDSTGRGFAVVQVPAEIGKIAAAAITLEPAGGSPQPTLPIYALGKIG